MSQIVFHFFLEKITQSFVLLLVILKKFFAKMSNQRDFVEQLSHKLNQIDPESILVKQSFNKIDLGQLVKNPELDEFESSIVKLLQLFYKFDINQTVKTLQEMIQKHATDNKFTSSDIEVSVMEKNHRFAVIQINYGWWRHNYSTYCFYPAQNLFAPVSFWSARCNGRGGVDDEKYDSKPPSMTLDDVFSQVVERYQ